MDSLPVPLLIQCLLYLIGNLFDDDDKPIPGLALLPRSIRIKLLLLLPAVDVHKLEGTSVTADILMDEIWETLYNEKYHKNGWQPFTRHPHILDKHIFSFKDLYFSAAMLDPNICGYHMFYDANKELSVYFTHVKESIYNDYRIEEYYSVDKDYRIATFHNAIWVLDRKIVTTKAFENKAVIYMCLDDRRLDLALVMVDLCIPLKIVTNSLLTLDNDILIKLTQSAEAIYWMRYDGYQCKRDNCPKTKIEEFLKIVFLENECHIKSCKYEQREPLLLDYLQQQCDLKVLHVDIDPAQEDPAQEDAAQILEDVAKFQKVVKHHRNLEVISIKHIIYANNCIQCLSELMYQPCFRQLTLSQLASSNGVHSLLSAFFLSPYPVTLKLDMVHHRLDLAINTEQQSKSLDVDLQFDDARWHDLECTFLPQCIVLKSLKIRRNYTLYLFSKVKSIKVDEITIDIDTSTNTDSLRSLLNIVSANDMTVYIKFIRHRIRRSTLEIIFNSLSPTEPPYLQLIVKYSIDDPSQILFDTWKRCGAIKLKKVAVYGHQNKLLEQMM